MLSNKVMYGAIVRNCRVTLTYISPTRNVWIKYRAFVRITDLRSPLERYRANFIQVLPKKNERP